MRGLLTAAGISYEPGQEGAQLPALLQQLKDLAARAGGAPPLPEAPDTDHLDALLALAGNQRFRQVADDHERLSADLERWRAAAARREKRETAWRDLERLLRHADGLPVAEAVAPAVAAIRDGRQLLDEPDPIAPLLTELVTALRAEVTQRAQQLADAQRAAVAELEAWPEWDKLDPADRDAIVAEAKLVPAPPPDVSTESKLLESLDAVPLSAWTDRITLVDSRRDQARQRAAKKLEPKSVEVKPPSATFKPGDDPDPVLRPAAGARAVASRRRQDRDHLRPAMRALPSSLRKQLETSVLAARRAAEAASRAAIESLGVFADRRPEHLDADAGGAPQRASREVAPVRATTATCSSRSARTSSGTGCCSRGSSPRTACCCTRSSARR